MPDPGALTVPPLLAGDWLDLEKDEFALAIDVLTAIASLPHLGFTRAPRQGRALALPFYGEDWSLIELEGRAKGGPATASLVLGPASALLLDGASPPIHQLNADVGLSRMEEPQVALLYLKFFCAHVQGEEGPFAIVESQAQAATWLTGDTAGLPIEPIVMGEDARSWAANVIYGRHLFRSHFELGPDGMVEMTDDDPLGEAGGPWLSFNPPLRIVPLGQAG